MTPKKRYGLGKAHESYGHFPGLSLLAVQPAGDLYKFDIPPQSAQFKPEKDNTKLLISQLEKKLLPITQPLQALENNRRGGVAMKVVFVLGKNDQEKDIDNMLKWFCDCFKEATKADDGLISDLRGMKFRCDSDVGCIGVSISSVNALNSEDCEMAQALAISTLPNPNDKTEEEVFEHISKIRNIHQDIHQPVYKLRGKQIPLPNGLVYGPLQAKLDSEST